MSNPETLYQNWMSGEAVRPAQRGQHSQDLQERYLPAHHQRDRGDDLAAVASQLSEDFVHLRHSGGGGVGNNSAAVQSRYGNVQRPPLQPGFNGPHSGWVGHGQGSLLVNSDPSADGMRPPQMTHYEPTLPASSGGVAGDRMSGRRHRQGRSDGSIDPRGSGTVMRYSQDDRSQRLSFDNLVPGSGLRSSHSSLQSSIDSDTSLGSHPQLRDSQDGGFNTVTAVPMPAPALTRLPLSRIGASVNTSVVRVPSEASKQSLNKPDIIESPRSKQAYREFYREFRLREKVSVEAARQQAETTLHTAPENCKWKIYLELADLAKRHDLIEEVSHWTS